MHKQIRYNRLKSVYMQETFACGQCLHSFFLFCEKRVVQVSCLALFFIYIGLRVFMQLLNLECDVIGGLITPVHSLKLS